MKKFFFTSKKLNTLLFVIGLFLFACTNDPIAPPTTEVKPIEIPGAVDTIPKHSQDPKTIDDVELLFDTPMTVIWHWRQNDYQYTRNLSLDMWSGYCAQPHHAFSFEDITNYNLEDRSHNGLSGGMILQAMQPNLPAIMAVADSLGVPEYGAIARILFAFGATFDVDAQGPINYNDFKLRKDGERVGYNGAKEAMLFIYRDLKLAREVLTNFLNTNPSPAKLEALRYFDRLCGGSYERWIQFANSIMFRLAIRMSKADPATAQQIGEDGVNNSYGLITQDVLCALHLSGKNGYANEYWRMFESWRDCVLGASWENLMKTYKIPFMERWYQTNSGNVANKNTGELMLEKNVTVWGIRLGLTKDDVGTDKAGPYSVASWLAQRWELRDPILLTVAEMKFAQAEAKLRGWNVGGGTAQSYYEEGIRSFFDRENTFTGLNASADDYINQNVAPVDYVDYRNSAYNKPPVCTLSVKWDEAASSELKLERIITQKYIANFPLACQAWAEFRRTGYPRLYPIVANNSAGKVDTDIQIRRMRWDESSSDPIVIGHLSTAKAKLLEEKTSAPEPTNTGENTAGTRIWWDTGGSNF